MASRSPISRDPPSLRSRRTIEALLASIGPHGTFAVRRRVPEQALRLSVRDVGEIPFPVPASVAKKLRSVARPARHGHKDQTRLDRSVRDTWEIARSRVRIDNRRWQAALGPELVKIRDELGLGSEQALRAELHNLLVYERGQFFKPHQDSEKTADMVATLVVMLPSEARGGSLMVEHFDQRKHFRASKDDLTLVAFYADCHHEVKPLTSGYRVVLTFNLRLTGAGASCGPDPDAQSLEALQQALQSYFAASASPRRPGDDEERRARLVYLLDHQYSQKSLVWSRLKRDDAARARALQDVADRMDCQTALALADVHETWGCEPDYRDSYAYRQWDDDDSEVDPSGYALSELFDSDVVLRHFVEEDGSSRAVNSGVHWDELLFTRPSVEMEPFESHHEGFMGNWGNTVDHWYHRAAVVVWPRAMGFRLRARDSANWALRELGRMIRADRVQDAVRAVEEILPFWPHVARRDSSARLAGQVLRVAAALRPAALAKQLATPLDVERLTPANAALLAEAAAVHGPAWAQDVLEAWHREPHDVVASQRLRWLPILPRVIDSLCAVGERRGRSPARHLVAGQWPWLLECYESAAMAPPSRMLESYKRLERSTLGVLVSAQVCGADAVHAAVVEHLTQGTVPPLALVALLKTALRSARASEGHPPGLGGVHAHCVSMVHARLQEPPRSPTDWSIKAKNDCGCKLCKELWRFLEAPDRKRFEWPLAAQKRRHIHGEIDAGELPVRHVTRRTGSPYTLVLEKTRELFTREANERRALLRARTWLARHAAHFAES